MKKLLLIALLIVGCEEPATHGCLDSQACNYDADATIDNNSCKYIDDCGVCDNDPDNQCLLDIYYDTNIPLSGFQFDITGVSIISSSGGIAEAAGFSVSSSDTKVLGFSFSGSTISIGEGTLIKLEVIGNIPNACLENVILSDASGNSPEFIIEDCNKIIVP